MRKKKNKKKRKIKKEPLTKKEERRIGICFCEKEERAKRRRGSFLFTKNLVF